MQKIIMSKSYKKAIYKDGSGKEHKELRRRIRSSTKNYIRTHKDELINGDIVLPDPKEIVNCYDWCDYKYDCEYDPPIDEESKKYWKEKLSRK